VCVCVCVTVFIIVTTFSRLSVDILRMYGTGICKLSVALFVSLYMYEY